MGRLQIVDGNVVLVVSKVEEEVLGVALEDAERPVVAGAERAPVSPIADEHKLHLVQARGWGTRAWGVMSGRCGETGKGRLLGEEFSGKQWGVPEGEALRSSFTTCSYMRMHRCLI